MPSPDELRAEETSALDRERQAFERRQRAFIAVHRQFAPFGSGMPSDESLTELDRAQAEWIEARSEMDRLADEIRTGKR